MIWLNIFCCLGLPAISQDIHFSQFYASPLSLNPALAGTGECSRIMMNYRNQWPSIDKGFATYSVSGDTYVRALSGGIGFLAYADDAAGLVKTLRVSAMYSYHLKISESTTLNAGFEAGFYQQNLNWDELIFADMIDPNSGSISPGISGELSPDNTTVIVPDFATGLVLGIDKKYFVGIAAHHLAQPDIGYYNSNSSLLYLKYSAHAGAYIKLTRGLYDDEKGNLFLVPNVLYQQQQNAKQLNGGFSLDYFPLSLGFWYRHNMDKPDAMIFLVGLKQKRFKFGYSYDTSLSKLKGESGGSHEVSFALLISCRKKRNRPGAIKCPEF